RQRHPAHRHSSPAAVRGYGDPVPASDASGYQRLVVKLTAGADAPERCSQGFTVAATAIVAGAQVSLWLAGESAWFGVPGHAERFELPHSAPLPDLLSSVLAAGTVTVCTQCATRRDIRPEQLIPGIRVAGSATFVEEVLAPGTQALVY